jgi:excisionase family DNA binding protein
MAVVVIDTEELRGLLREVVDEALRKKGDEEALTRSQAARALHMHPKSVVRLVRRGELRGKRVGRVWRFRRADVDACLAARAEGV